MGPSYVLQLLQGPTIMGPAYDPIIVGSYPCTEDGPNIKFINVTVSHYYRSVLCTPIIVGSYPAG